MKPIRAICIAIPHVDCADTVKHFVDSSIDVYPQLKGKDDLSVAVIKFNVSTIEELDGLDEVVKDAQKLWRVPPTFIAVQPSDTTPEGLTRFWICEEQESILINIYQVPLQVRLNGALEVLGVREWLDCEKVIFPLIETCGFSPKKILVLTDNPHQGLQLVTMILEYLDTKGDHTSLVGVC